MASHIPELFEKARRSREAETAVFERFLAAGCLEVGLPLAAPPQVFTSEEVVRFVDGQGQVMGFRADFTGPLARLVATRLADHQPLRLCYRGLVLRPGPAGSVASGGWGAAQSHQAGFELFDDRGAAADAEAVALALSACDAAGLAGARATLGSAALIEALVPGASRAVREALDFRDRGALPAALLPLLDLSGDPATVLARAAKTLPSVAQPALAQLAAVVAGLRPLAARVALDLAEVRPWSYYSGPVFNLFAPGLAAPVGGGGRYDGLVGRHGPVDRAAVGAFLDLDLLAEPASDGRRRPLTVALPKGRIRQPLLERLGALGPDAESLESRRLQVPGQAALRVEGSAAEAARLSFLLVKDPDIAAYVARGAADLGLVGLDLLEETPAEVLRPLDTGLGRCTLSLCGRPGTDLAALSARGTLRVASKYPALARRALDARRLSAQIIPLQGSVELAILAGLAEAIVDLVETGSTLAANGLVVLEPLLACTARAVVNRAAWHLRTGEIQALLARLA